MSRTCRSQARPAGRRIQQSRQLAGAAERTLDAADCPETLLTAHWLVFT